jgi:hypothetical protein
MQIEVRAQLEITGGTGFGLYGLRSDHEQLDPFRSVEHGNDSLAVSIDAGNVQWALAEYLQAGWFDWLQPRILVDRDWVTREVEADAKRRHHARVRFASRLIAAFEAEPVEDGMVHSAQSIIDAALRSTERSYVFEWLWDYCLDATQPNFAASVLRCLARLPNADAAHWRAELVRSALAMDDAEIRDAAVQAAEYWGGGDVLEVLKTHDEPLPWLRRYVRDVIEDLGDSRVRGSDD